METTGAVSPPETPAVLAETSRIRFIFRDTVLPRTWWLYSFHVVAIAKALCYWIVALRAHTGADLSVLSIYRPPLPSNDIQYYPWIAALSRFNFGDPSILEYHRHGFGAFPIFSILPHALCYAVFGKAGFLVADIVCTLLFFVVLAALFRLVGFGSLVSRAVSVLATTSALLFLWQKLHDATGFVPLYTAPELWGDRILRPYVTDTALLLMLCALIAVARSRAHRASRGAWYFLGVASGILIQSDVYAAMSLLPIVLVLLGSVLVRGRKLDRDSMRPLVWFGIAAFLCCIPFLLQAVFAHPDLSRRLGVYRTARTLFWPHPDAKPRLYFIVACCLFIRFVLPARDDAARATRRAVTVLGLASVLSYFCITYSFFLLGRTIQPYHFRPIWSRVSTVTLVAFALILLREIVRVGRSRLAPRHWRRRITMGLSAGLLLWTCWVGSKTVYANRPTIPSGPVRWDFDEYASLKNYRNDFIALVEELRKPAYNDAQVLATFDHHLFVWWVTFERRFSFMADPFSSTVSDQILESRIMQFCKLLHLSKPAFLSIIKQQVVTKLWLGHDKYQASHAYSFAPAAEYSPAIQHEIASGSPFEAWSVAVPRSELERLSAAYDRVEPGQDGARLPDVIVLTASNFERPLIAAVPESYTPSFSNATFRVWQRRSQ